MLVETGLIWETWKVGWIQREGGKLSRTAVGLMIAWISNGPMKRGESFLVEAFNGMILFAFF